MSEEGKKISFGFSKTSKKPLFQAPAPNEKDYIKCIDDKSIKLINEKTQVVNGPLVIPLIESSNSWKNKLEEKFNSKNVSTSIEMPKNFNSSAETSNKLNSLAETSKNFNYSAETSKKLNSSVEMSNELNSSVEMSKKLNSSSEMSKNFNSTSESSKNSSAASDNLKIPSSSPAATAKDEIEILEIKEIKKEVEVINIEENNKEEAETSNVSKLNKVEIDEKEWDRLAAEELLQDSKKKIKVDNSNDFKIEITESNLLVGKEESTLEDYERIPIEQFGMAMLRGMGWHPDRGVGKKPQLVTTEIPLSRPRGMGLGADKVAKKPLTSGDGKKKDLKLEEGCFVKLNAGKFMGHYGQVKGFNENAGRVMVKLSLLDDVQSFNEFMLDLVSKEEFSKNSKVINISKYEEYKNRSRDSEDARSRVNGRVKKDRGDKDDKGDDDDDDDERRQRSYSSRDKKRDRERSRSKERFRTGKNKHQRRDRERSRSRERENKHERRDKSGDRHKHKKSKHHKKHSR